jgi:hypothetical protein
VGVGSVAERQHAVQRAVAALGPGGGGVRLCHLPGQAQHLPRRGHRPAGHRLSGQVTTRQGHSGGRGGGHSVRAWIRVCVCGALEYIVQ